MKNQFLGIALLAGAMIVSCEQRNRSDIPEQSTADTAVLNENERLRQAADDHPVDIEEMDRAWNTVDMNVAVIRVPEVSSSEVEVRGNEAFTIYGVEERILFDTDQSTIRPGAEESLRQIATSIENRHNRGNIRLYGYTDARASASYNKELAEERARSVKQWLAQNANMDESRISIHPVGEAPVEAASPEGRQLNRRVMIVAMNPAQ